MVSSGNKLRLLMDLLLVALVPVKCTTMKLYLFLCKLLIKSSINQSCVQTRGAPCTMNYMEVYGEEGSVELGSHFEKTLNELTMTF